MFYLNVTVLILQLWFILLFFYFEEILHIYVCTILCDTSRAQVQIFIDNIKQPSLSHF